MIDEKILTEFPEAGNRYYRTQLKSMLDKNGGFEKVDPVSMTVPDMNLSIPQIYQNIAKGIMNPDIEKIAYYGDNEDDFDNIDISRSPDFDLADATELVESAKLNAVRIKDNKSQDNEGKNGLNEAKPNEGNDELEV